MPMRHVFKFNQSDDKFEREPQGVCQALSARWIVSRAQWDSGRDGQWAGGSWMGSKRDMEAHVSRIYSATRSARAIVAREEQSLMEQEARKFEAEKLQLVKRARRMVTAAASVNAAGIGASPPEATPAGYSPADLQARLARVYIPTLPRMLEALMKDISEHSGLEGTVHTYDNVSPDHAAQKICALGSGYKLIDVRDASLSSEGGAHAIAAELRDGDARLFDPNVGEFAYEPPGGAWDLFSALVQFLLRKIYELSSIRYLSVIHFAP